MTPLEKAKQLYRDAFMRWCYEPSLEKNILTAKSICEYTCNQVMGDMGADRGYAFWDEVKHILKTHSHADLFVNNTTTKEELDLWKAVEYRMDEEGYEYCFEGYSSWSSIKDEEFHRLRNLSKEVIREMRIYVHNKIKQGENHE